MGAMKQLDLPPTGLVFRLHKSELYGDHHIAGRYLVKRSAVNEEAWVAFCYPEMLGNSYLSDAAAFEACRCHAQT